MNQKIKTIGRRILKIFAWIIFLFSIYPVLFIVIPDLHQYGISGWVLNDWIGLIVLLGIIFGFGYILRNTLLAPFRVFARLTFERKMMLIVVIAILAGVGFYCWSAWQSIHHYSKVADCVGWCWWNRESLFRSPELLDLCLDSCKSQPDLPVEFLEMEWQK